MSKHPSANLEKNLIELSARISSYPTIPKEPGQPALPMQAVFDDNVAQLLPPKHCAFQECTWQLEWQSSENMTERLREQRLLDHVMTDHKSEIAEVACLFPLCFSEEERFAAAYNEAIAIKVRQGAPLASYSIDRRCLRKLP